MRHGDGAYWLASKFVVPPVTVKDDLHKRHSIVIDHMGLAVRITRDKFSIRSRKTGNRSYRKRSERQLSDEAYGGVLKRIMERMVSTVSNWPPTPDAEEFKGVAIVIHGGNESPLHTLEPSERMIPLMIRDGYYPIFIHWDASIASAYREQLFCIRSGCYVASAILTGVFGLLGDIFTTVGRFVPITLSQAALASRRLSEKAFASTRELERFQPAPPNIDVRLTPIKTTEPIAKLLWEVAILPLRILVAAPLVHIVVPRAWQNLLRRTQAMFRTPREFDPAARAGEYKAPDPASYSPREGAMAVFLRELGRTIEAHPELGIKVDAFAHSMGAMIANEAVSVAPDLPWRNLVYLAPACSVRSFAETVSPLIRRRAPEVQAMVLTLHPKVELVQADLKGLSPVGSVLEWLEGFLTPPNSYLDRFLGKWNNAFQSLHIFENDVRPFLHLKAMPYDPRAPRKPCMHKEFNDPGTGFWKEEFYR